MERMYKLLAHKFLMYKRLGIFLQVTIFLSILFRAISVVYGDNSTFDEGRVLAKLTAEVIVREGAAPVFSGGSGTEDDPYIITTPEQLNEVRNYLSSCFELGVDLDLDCEPFNTGGGWMPIGTEEEPFTGRMDGNGYLISNLYIQRTTNNYKHIGLFGYAENAVFKGIQLKNVKISGYYYVGGLVGHNVTGIINECCSTGSITGLGYCVGGLIGFNDAGSQINNSYSRCNLEGIGSSSGGLAGKNDGLITNSYATGNVTGKSAGGLFWENNGNVYNCYAAGFVSATSKEEGGLAGSKSSSGTTYSSYWDKDTTGQSISPGGGTPLTTAAMKRRDSFKGWDFTGAWRIIDGETYPYLWWQPGTGIF